MRSAFTTSFAILATFVVLIATISAGGLSPDKLEELKQLLGLMQAKEEAFDLPVCDTPFVPASVEKRIDDAEIASSHVDTRNYRYLRTENGVQVMLVSDKMHKSSTVACTIKAGYMHDPENMEGSTNLLETFLQGSVENDDEALAKYVRSNKGRLSVRVANGHTAVFYSVAPEGLEGTLQLLVQALRSPAITPKSVERAVSSLKTMHATTKEETHQVWQQLFKSSLNPKNPFSRSPYARIGEMDNLLENVEETVMILAQHVQEIISADLITLVIITALPLEDMENLALKYVGGLPNKQLTGTLTTDVHKLPLFVEESKGKFVFMSAHISILALFFVFQMPASFDTKNLEPWDYVKFIFTSYNLSSFSNALNLSKIAKSMVVNTLDFDHYNTLAFSFVLHDSEISPVTIQALGEYFFGFLALIKKTPINLKLITDDILVQNLFYDRAPLESNTEFAYDIARNMQFFDEPHFIKGDSVKVPFTEEDVADAYQHISIDNMQMYVISNYEAQTNTLEEVVYGTKYTAEPIPGKFKQEWSKYDSMSLGELRAINRSRMLSIPNNNPYIPSSYAPIPFTKEIKENLAKTPKVYMYPEPLDLAAEQVGWIGWKSGTDQTENTDNTDYKNNTNKKGVALHTFHNVEAFYKQDDRFGLPDAQIVIEITSPFIASSIENFIASTFMLSVQYSYLNQKILNGQNSGLYLLINEDLSRRVITLKFEGFSHKLLLFLLDVAQGLVGDVGLSMRDFNASVAKCLSDIKQHKNNSNSFSAHQSYFESLFYRDHVSVKQNQDALNSLTVSRYREAAANAFKNGRARILFFGNLPKDAAATTCVEFLKITGLISTDQLMEVSTGHDAALPKGSKSGVLTASDTDVSTGSDSRASKSVKIPDFPRAQVVNAYISITAAMNTRPKLSNKLGKKEYMYNQVRFFPNLKTAPKKHIPVRFFTILDESSRSDALNSSTLVIPVRCKTPKEQALFKIFSVIAIELCYTYFRFSMKSGSASIPLCKSSKYLGMEYVVFSLTGMEETDKISKKLFDFVYEVALKLNEHDANKDGELIRGLLSSIHEEFDSFPSSVTAEAEFYASELSAGTYDFAYHHKIANTTKTLTPQDFNDFLTQLYQSTHYSIQTVGKKLDQAPSADNVYADLISDAVHSLDKDDTNYLDKKGATEAWIELPSTTEFIKQMRKAIKKIK